MTLAELMQGRTSNPDYEGITTADDMVLAVGGFNSAQTNDPSTFFVAQTGIVEHSGALDHQEEESQYIRTGKVVTKTGTSRSFNVNGDRYVGDKFQDEILSHKIKYGRGEAVVKPFVYFNILTGKGEKGTVSIAVENDPSGSAGSNAGFSAVLTSIGEPEEYTYEPVSPEPASLPLKTEAKAKSAQ